ncbi:DUF1853 family protein [Maribacter sp. MMG018]|uniref:DUF1853 family protein n=1 Tax=Maribacter sp. MMG018 TaxID=2822688 RepID=UPI001FFC9CE5|nr:DUF1853 family protein [Maribacter sp. MMG018]
MYLSNQIKGFVNTPPLWSKSEFGIQQFEFPYIDLSFYNAVAIPQKIRLGHQMEFIFKQLLDYCPAYEVLAHNIPIRQEKHTIGEIDFILKKIDDQQLLHIELTYKFYVVTIEVSDPIHQLIGPNKRDSFFSKMKKIKDNQFPLLHTKAGTASLKKIGIDPSIVSHQACFKAQLFLPFNCKSIDLYPFDPNCIVGYWLRPNDFRPETYDRYEFYLPFKSQWVVEPNDNVQWLSFNKILPEINLCLIKQNAPLIWMKKNNNTFEKFFIVWW